MSVPFEIGIMSRAVVEIQFDRVKLNEGFLGNCSPCFPQYFIKAILLGACQVTCV